jgi:hypothetical protein
MVLMMPPVTSEPMVVLVGDIKVIAASTKIGEISSAAVAGPHPGESLQASGDGVMVPVAASIRRMQLLVSET